MALLSAPEDPVEFFLDEIMFPRTDLEIAKNVFLYLKTFERFLE